MGNLTQKENSLPRGTVQKKRHCGNIFRKIALGAASVASVLIIGSASTALGQRDESRPLERRNEKGEVQLTFSSIERASYSAAKNMINIGFAEEEADSLVFKAMLNVGLSDFVKQLAPNAKSDADLIDAFKVRMSELRFAKTKLSNQPNLLLEPEYTGVEFLKNLQKDNGWTVTWKEATDLFVSLYRGTTLSNYIELEFNNTSYDRDRAKNIIAWLEKNSAKYSMHAKIDFVRTDGKYTLDVWVDKIVWQPKHDVWVVNEAEKDD